MFEPRVPTARRRIGGLLQFEILLHGKPAASSLGERRAASRSTMKKYMCLICGWLYDEEQGAPDEGIPAGTRWEDVPPNWTCPECGARKEDFEMIEI
jgi:rubredoxin